MTNQTNPPQEVDVSVEDDLMIVRVIGGYTVDVTRYVASLSDQQCERYGYHLMIVDLRRAGRITPEGRKAVIQSRRRNELPEAVAILGANFAMRTLAQLVIRAKEILTGMAVRVVFSATEEEARRWVGVQRARIKAELGPTTQVPRGA